MPALSELEVSTQHLRACLGRAQGVNALLCGLWYFRSLTERSGVTAPSTFLEASLREFVPELADAARQSHPGDLLPDEIQSLQELIDLIRSTAGIVAPSQLDVLESFLKAAHTPVKLLLPRCDDDQVTLAGLFVEHLPELHLSPRGRLLWLRVEAEPRRHGKTDDQAIIRNATIKPDDEFRHQAGLAVRLAREYLARRYQVDPRKRFRVDFEVEGATGPLTGPSLGLALAVGATVAIAKKEILRESLNASHAVAFSGALLSDGRLTVIDGEGLRLKLVRAIHSGLRHVIVPREHIAEAWEFVRQHSPQDSSNRINLAAADDLASVLDDRNLVFPQRRTRMSFGLLRFRKRMQEPRVGIPIFLALVAILGFIAWPHIQSWFDNNPVELREMRRGFTVYNQYGRTLWSKEFVCDSVVTYNDPPSNERNWRIDDLDGDGKNEVIYVPVIRHHSPDANRVFCLNSDGGLRFRRQCQIPGEYPGDTIGVYYDFEHINVPRVSGQPVVVTEIATSSPARSHIKFWDANGDSLGWYINAGGSKFVMAKDLNQDGREELLFHCYYHRLMGTSLLVISVDSAFGCSPPYDRFKPDGQPIEHGRQYGYIFMPTTEMGRTDISSHYSQPHQVRALGERQIAVYNSESKDPFAAAAYLFNDDLHLERITFTDQFVARHAQLVDSGRVQQADLSLEAARLRDSVLYWTPQGWVGATRVF